MKIYGIGIDIVDTKRIEGSIDEFGDRFLRRIFTRSEREYCAKMAYPGSHYAVRFAAKEAIAKAFGTGIGEHLNWTDMEILHDSLGKPFVLLSGNGKEFAGEKGISEVMVSLTHSGDHAVANAVAICA